MQAAFLAIFGGPVDPYLPTPAAVGPCCRRRVAIPFPCGAFPCDLHLTPPRRQSPAAASRRRCPMQPWLAVAASTRRIRQPRRHRRRRRPALLTPTPPPTGRQWIRGQPGTRQPRVVASMGGPCGRRLVPPGGPLETPARLVPPSAPFPFSTSTPMPTWAASGGTSPIPTVNLQMAPPPPLRHALP